MSVFRRLSEEKGVASLEMLGVVFAMLAITMGLWSLTVVIYNQTLLNTSTQFASQAAIIYWDRGSTRSSDGNQNQNNAARASADAAAKAVFANNMVQRMPDQFAKGPTTSRVQSVEILCSTSWAQSGSWANCTQAGGKPADANLNALVTRARVTSSADGISWLMVPFNTSGDQYQQYGGAGLYRGNSTSSSISQDFCQGSGTC